MGSIDTQVLPSSLGIVKHSRRRLTGLALFAVVALTTVGMTWGSVAAPGNAADACCHRTSSATSTTPKPFSGHCGSLSPLLCCDQPFSLTTADALDLPSLTLALISSAPALLPSATQVLSVVLAPARAAPSAAYHTVLRL